MAIEKVKRVWFLVERADGDAFVQGLADSETTHVVDLKPEAERPETGASDFLPVEAAGDPSDAQDKVHKLARVLDVLDRFVPPRRSFADNFVSLPTEMSRDEYERSVAETDPDDLYQQATALSRDHAAVGKQAEELRAGIARLEPWADADLPPAGLDRCGADLGTVPEKTLPRLHAAAAERDLIALETVSTAKGKALVAAAWLNEAGDEAPGLLEAHGFESLNLEPGSGPVAGVVRERQAEFEAAEKRTEELAGAAAELAKGRRAVLAAHGYWQAEVERIGAAGNGLGSKRIVVLSGYVRVRELPALERLLNSDFPSVSLVARDPQPDEDVPVSLRGPKLFAPAQFLTSMFGLPNYFEFDPSPYIFLTFLIFFGFCFGDVVYGLMLLGLGWWLARKSRDYPSLARFFSLLMWGGIASIAVGALTSSWAADLFSTDPVSGEANYLGRGPVASAFLAFQAKLTLVNPLQKVVLVLAAALGLGILNQFYGMILLMYRNWRKRDYVAALCDGGLWLIFLPGLLLLLVGGMAGLPSGWTTLALWMIALSAVGLVLTQGRREESFAGKAITGVVSLYGILGTYGVTSFIGDVLSYSRLLALGLTTYVVGFAFNIIATRLPDVIARLLDGLSSMLSPFQYLAAFVRLPLVALLITVVLILIGHGLNFVISILGGFVHSARLIFVEFFTKFYEGGAPAFRPLGAPQTVRITDET